MELVKALREASDFYAKERPRGVPPNLLSNEIGPAECGIPTDDGWLIDY